jgi:hypothetical protein
MIETLFGYEVPATIPSFGSGVYGSYEVPVRTLRPGAKFTLCLTSGHDIHGYLERIGAGSATVVITDRKTRTIRVEGKEIEISQQLGTQHWCLDTLVTPTGTQYDLSVTEDRGGSTVAKDKKPKKESPGVLFEVSKNDGSAMLDKANTTNAALFYRALAKASKPLKRGEIYAACESTCETAAAFKRLGGQIGDTLGKLRKLGLVKRVGEPEPKAVTAKAKAPKAAKAPKKARKAKSPKAGSAPAQSEVPVNEQEPFLPEDNHAEELTDQAIEELDRTEESEGV